MKTIVFIGCIFSLIFTAGASDLGQIDALRVYVEFADGSNRGMYNNLTQKGGFPDEDYDATTAMVINWHKLPENDSVRNSLLEIRQEHPVVTDWVTYKGESRKFWFREELVNRCIIKNLNPNSVYAFRFKDNGTVFRLHTMPSNLNQREIKIVITSDLQSPLWNNFAHGNAKLVSKIKPDMFLALGDFVNCEGQITAENAKRWATYLDYLYNIDSGYFIYQKEIENQLFSNIVLPHVAILGNHEIGDRNHIRWPACIIAPNPEYPKFTAANWMELLFHFPFSSEGFYSEFHSDHPNINKEHAIPGFGHGGYGKLSFSDYFLLIALDNSQNWEGLPNKGLRDWKGDFISENWPWFEKNQSEIRQDLWLNNLLEPTDGISAGERYDYIIPVWHRGLFGSARFNMSYKNRDILEYWLPVLYRNGVKFFAEAHDHLYGRSIPLGIYTEQPGNTYLEKVYYKPRAWTLSSTLPESYKDDFFSVNCIKVNSSDEIVGWEYNGNYITYEPNGMRSFGYGGWAAGRREAGDFGGGNTGWWFNDESKGGAHISGKESYHINLLTLSTEGIKTEAIGTNQLENILKGIEIEPIHRLFWNKREDTWSDQK